MTTINVALFHEQNIKEKVSQLNDAIRLGLEEYCWTTITIIETESQKGRSDFVGVEVVVKPSNLE